MRNLYALILIFSIFLFVGHLEYRWDVDKKPQAMPLSFYETRLAEFLVANQSPAPVEMAQAIVRAKRPKVAAAQAIVESNGSPKAVGKKAERGAWQVREKYWGKVHEDPHRQLLQNEKIMDELLEASGNDLEKALRLYNGKGVESRRYARRVLAKMEEIK